MSEIHLQPVPGTSVVAHNPGQHPLPVGAGQPVTKTGAAISGQVNVGSGTPGPVFRNPA